MSVSMNGSPAAPSFSAAVWFRPFAHLFDLSGLLPGGRHRADPGFLLQQRVDTVPAKRKRLCAHRLGNPLALTKSRGTLFHTMLRSIFNDRSYSASAASNWFLTIAVARG